MTYKSQLTLIEKRITRKGERQCIREEDQHPPTPEEQKMAKVVLAIFKKEQSGQKLTREENIVLYGKDVPDQAVS